VIQLVYCKNCRHVYDWDFPDMCKVEGTYINYYGNKSYKIKCSSKNEMKDCKDYERKWWKFWV
jgi:hypothetical protein